ncbi:hypothetical protein GUJ93_ZPchr0782g29148 [Zizania palustris]|uniref:Uncharacterized protein n=1 Tax=Zizania palustris TaxID=103762 RepID=A0A8J5RM25_ZIZPA|nr:hypothetical protein GUJ93_ZPchr0782g29148 [Zizania palustris]
MHVGVALGQRRAAHPRCRRGATLEMSTAHRRQALETSAAHRRATCGALRGTSVRECAWNTEEAHGVVTGARGRASRGRWLGAALATLAQGDVGRLRGPIGRSEL